MGARGRKLGESSLFWQKKHANPTSTPLAAPTHLMIDPCIDKTNTPPDQAPDKDQGLPDAYLARLDHDPDLAYQIQTDHACMR